MNASRAPRSSGCLLSDSQASDDLDRFESRLLVLPNASLSLANEPFGARLTRATFIREARQTEAN
jgi:hypothetical protein